MKTAIELLRNSAKNMDGTSIEGFNKCVKEFNEAADLLEKLSNSKANQVALPSVQSYAQRDALMTMAMFVGLPTKAAEHFIGLLLYVQELEKEASRKDDT